MLVQLAANIFVLVALKGGGGGGGGPMGIFL